jgi:hypothetical protein
MTRVERRYGLSRPLDDDLLERIARLHSVYGFLRLVPGPDGLLVDWDASRLTERDVEAHLRRAGIPIELNV